jgi:co-chaperonin GroES (HSP10)
MSSIVIKNPINPDAFMKEMSDHWTINLKNTASLKLKAMWKGMAETFNQSIQDSAFEGAEQWKVLQPPTGSGKTQGLIVYLSMLAKESPEVGALIVVRLKAQADDIVNQINTKVGRSVAIAKHSGNKVSIVEAEERQILVITHQAYENSLVSYSSGKSSAFQSHMLFNRFDRTLVVIDESIDVVKQSQLELEDLRKLIGNLPVEAEDKCPEEMDSLNKLEGVLKDARSNTEAKLLWDEQSVLVSVLPLIEYIHSVRWDHKTLKRNDLTAHTDIKSNLIKTLMAADELIAGFSWYSKNGQSHTLNSAKHILPETISSGVVLDATASQNLVWELLGNKAELIEPVEGLRNYSNVTLRTCRQSGLGKHKMLKSASDRVALLLNDLPKHIPHGNRVLVVCHKGLIPFMDKQTHPFRELSVINWGAIDGRNDWDDYETVVIYGLPYRNPIDSRNLFMAVQGPQDSDWLSGKSERSFNGRTNILFDIEVGFLTSSIVQAINRIKCRRVVNDKGECEKATILLLLAPDKECDAVLSGIKKEMPNMTEAEWDFEGFGQRPAGRPKTAKHEDLLVSWCLTALRGVYKSKEIRSVIGIPQSSWERLIKEMRATGSELNKRMTDLNVYYINNGKGRSASISIA